MEDKAKTEVGSATVRAFVIGVILSGVFAWLTAVRDNFPPIIFLSVNLLPALPYVALVVTGLVINPILDRIRVIRRFDVSEKLLIFVMCAVSSGTASFGLAGRVVPLVTSVSNPDINTVQSQLDIYAMPYLNEKFFIMVPGSREAATRVRDAHEAFQRARQVHTTARDLLNGRGDLKRIAAEREKVGELPTEAMRKAFSTRLDYAESKAEGLVAMAEASWQELEPEDDPETVVATYGEKVDGLRDRRDALREELRALNQDAFDAVARIREGLPDGDRAIPGLLYIPGEGRTRYAARVRRWRVGSAALGDLRRAVAVLDSCIDEGKTLPAEWPGRLEKAADALDPIADGSRFEAWDEKLAAELRRLETELEETNAELRKLYQKRRFATADGVDALNRQIDDLETPAAALQTRIDALRAKIDDQVKPTLAACELVRETQSALRALADDAKTVGADGLPVLRERLGAAETAFRQFDGSTRRFLVGDGDWAVWIGPIVNWLVLVFLGYVVFMAFNTLIYRQWAQNEKLIYPIAEITTMLAADGSDPEEKGPQLLKSGLFWFGFVVAAGVLGWNYLAKQDIIPNVSPIGLQSGLHTYVGWSGVMSGIGSSYFVIIFAVIGLSFLVPANISFSLWFFEILCMCMWLVLAWMGHGNNRWAIGNDPRFNLGGGAMLVFGAVILWTCRDYLLCAFRSAALKGLADDERKELRIASGLFLGGMLILILLLTVRFEVNLFHTVLYMLMALAITIAMVRAVAEGGVLGLECGFGAFSFITKVFGTANAWCAPTLFAPLAIFNGVLIGSLKGFIAPTMANSLKIREQIRVRRLWFHAAIGVAIVVASVVGIVTLIILSYEVGANSLHKWMHEAHGPGIKEMIASPAEANPIHTRWILAGAVLMTVLLIARRSCFWIPHPIGLVVFINPVMYGFWGSILIGWIFKSLVSKYCSKEQYFHIRCFFVGLVVGHLFAGLCGWDKLDWHWG